MEHPMEHPVALDEADLESADVDEAAAPAEAAATLESITSLAGSSSCAKFSWSGRGHAPSAYIEGVALTFGRAVCNPTRADVVFASRARTTGSGDVLNWYNKDFAAAHMTNEVAGVDTLRHLYTVLIGLGMRESSGEYCCGRDKSASFSSSSTAEAGPFQTSYGSKGTNSLLQPLMDSWVSAGDSHCHLDVWSKGVKCSSWDAKTWGTGEGATWQTLTKKCPTFAAEWAIALLRTSGGSRGEWGPLRTHAAQVRPECDNMLKEVQEIVEKNPSLCAEL